MNSIIKLLLLLLLSTQLFSTELTIIIPGEYKKSEPPLPPFPKEALKSLPEIDYSEDLLEFKIYSIPQEAIHYNYYPEILNLFVQNKYLLDTSGSISIDEGVTSRLLSSLHSNSYSLSIEGSNALDYNSISYKEYRLPVTVGVEASPFEEKYKIGLSFKNYFHSATLDGTFTGLTFNGSFEYLGNSFLYNYIKVDYLEELEGVVATGKRYTTGYFLAGASRYGEAIQPYVQLQLGRSINFEIDTVITDNIDYQLLTGYKNLYLLGLGYTFDYSLTPDKPAIILKSRYNGEKTLVLREDSLETDLNFYFSDLLINIIFNYHADKIYGSGKVLYKNWSYGLIWDDYDILIQLGYEVVL